ncbi:MAG: FtsQ-type POTRA domain-containing protein [Acidimicrobiia bacterium]|nr:FtsQ-type POTRA domain-containing protein [Acidimicrobiia bacterium]
MNGSVLDRPRVSPPIDDRLRARRIEVRRVEGRRRLRRLVVAIGITVVALVAWGVTRSPLLDVDHIEVHGATQTASGAIATASSIGRGDPLTDVDLSSARGAIAALPWVASVEVTRSWSGTIDITVVERMPTLVLRDVTGESWLVDADGWVLASATSPTSLVTVTGVPMSAVGQRLEPVPHHLLALAESASGTFRSAVSVIEVDASGEVWGVLRPRPGEVDADGGPRTDGGRIRFGDARSPGEEMLAATTVLDHVDLTDLEVLDVRVPSNPVVTRVPWADDASDASTDQDSVG